MFEAPVSALWPLVIRQEAYGTARAVNYLRHMIFRGVPCCLTMYVQGETRHTVNNMKSEYVRYTYLGTYSSSLNIHWP